MKYVWDEHAWADYLWWQAQDRKVLKRINTLLQDVVRNGNEGIGKPDPLKHGFHGYWSRRITDDEQVWKTYLETLLTVGDRAKARRPGLGE